MTSLLDRSVCLISSSYQSLKSVSVVSGAVVVHNGVWVTVQLCRDVRVSTEITFLCCVCVGMMLFFVGVGLGLSVWTDISVHVCVFVCVCIHVLSAKVWEILSEYVQEFVFLCVIICFTNLPTTGTGKSDICYLWPFVTCYLFFFLITEVTVRVRFRYSIASHMSETKHKCVCVCAFLRSDAVTCPRSRCSHSQCPHFPGQPLWV